MPKTQLEAIRAWGPRCYACGEIATFRSVVISLQGDEWVFTNGVLKMSEFIGGSADQLPIFVFERAQRWSRELEALGLPFVVNWNKLPPGGFRWYYCEEHRQGSSEALHYRDLLLPQPQVEEERPKCLTRFERMLEDE
jgi:hypothetical protein